MQRVDQDHLVYLNALNCISFLGPRRITALIDCLKTAKKAWEAPVEDLNNIADLQDYTGKLRQERAKIDPQLQWKRLNELEIRCVSVDCTDYPVLLKQLTCPPPILYYRGDISSVDQPAVAVVGSRRATFYGKEVAHRLAVEMAQAGVSVVSGMALGIDTAAHRGALENSGYTIAVMGCGLDHCYPPRNADLMEQIVSGGAVLSEFPLGTKPLPNHFPQRNRIISGLSLGTVVVEATAKSGSLITADYALEQNREVFAVPGNVGSPYSRGCHRLIKDGARLVESAADILSEIFVNPSSEEQLTIEDASSLTEEEKSLLGLIPYQPMHIDDIIHACGSSAAGVISVLLSLELKSFIRQTPGKYFCRI